MPSRECHNRRVFIVPLLNVTCTTGIPFIPFAVYLYHSGSWYKSPICRSLLSTHHNLKICVTFLNILISFFQGEGSLALHPIRILHYGTLSSLRRCLYIIYTATVSSMRNVRTCASTALMRAIYSDCRSLSRGPQQKFYEKDICEMERIGRKDFDLTTVCSFCTLYGSETSYNASVRWQYFYVLEYSF
jgi:hypothetical protein